MVAVFAGLLTLVGVSLAVGTKLVLLSRRTRAFPELALGGFFLLGGGLGYPLSGLAPLAGAWKPMLGAVSAVIIAVAMTMLYAFTARVFHAGRLSGRIGLAIGALLGVLYALGYSISQITATNDEEILRSTMVWGGVSLVMAAGGFCWTTFASLREYALQRRRLALGLADPVVANRMLLWGLMGLSICAAIVIDTALLYAGTEFTRKILIPLVTSVGGLLFGVFLTLAFFPPASYLAAIRRRQVVSEADR